MSLSSRRGKHSFSIRDASATSEDDPGVSSSSIRLKNASIINAVEDDDDDFDDFDDVDVFRVVVVVVVVSPAFPSTVVDLVVLKVLVVVVLVVLFFIVVPSRPLLYRYKEKRETQFGTKEFRRD